MTADDRRTRAVVFDLDGVLVDSEGLHVEAWKAVFGRLGVEVTDEEYAHGVGMADVDWLRWLFERRGLPSEGIAGCQRAKRRAFQAILSGNVRPFPGVVELVGVLRGEFALGVASNSSRESVATVLRRLGVGEGFGAVVGAEDVRRHKPHPEVYLRAAALLGVAPGACAVVEDSPLGIRAAKAAGMRCIGITNSLPAERLAEADLVVATLADAGTLLRFLRGVA